MEKPYQHDIDLVGRIKAVPSILDVVARTTGMGFAAVARVTADRWIACQTLDNIDFGLKAGGELKIETTICHEIHQTHDEVVIENVAEDPVYCGHHTPALYGFQSYISVPILLPDGSFFGTLCAIDPKPAKIRGTEIVGMFKLFAELIAFHVDAEQRLEHAESSLATERHASELTEQFIAVLGHDLRNPVASIQAGTKLLQKTALDDRAKAVVGLMGGSVHRINGLIDNVMDFARGRLGGGITLAVDDTESILPALQQVVAELRQIHPERRITEAYAFDDRFAADGPRLAQLFSNLLANAITHGAQGEPIAVQAGVIEGSFVLSVSNAGTIAADTMPHLFQPFVRGRKHGSAQGLGLGLYIAAEIARAHSGTLTVQSAEGRTTFTFRMPVDPVVETMAG